MRSRERVQRILEHREADRVPFDRIGFPEALMRSLCARTGLAAEETEYLSEGEFRYLEFRLEPDRAALLPYLPDLPAGAELTPFGVGELPLRTAEGWVAGNLLHHPLARVESVAELERFPFPDVAAPSCHAHLEAEVRAARDAGFTVVGQMSQTILETAYSMRGLERLFLDFAERPGYVRALFDILAERRVFQARRFAEAGVDVLRIGDDIATQAGLIVGPAMYREWIKPRHARVVAAARAVNPEIQVLYHSDGRLVGLLDELIDAGVTAVNPCQPEAMDPAEVKRAFGDRLTLWGCTATQSSYARGTPHDVEQDLDALMRQVAPGGGLVLQFYNMLVTPAVERNLERFVELYFRAACYR